MNVRNIIIAIIENNDDVGDAADMLIRLFGQPKGADQPPSAQSPLAPIEAGEYYSVEVARRQTGYTAKHIYSLIKKDKVVCKPDGRRRMILGSEIMRLRAARGIIPAPTAQGEQQC